MLSRVALVKQVAIHIMFHDEFAWIKPIIKDLTPHDVSPDPPAVFVPLVTQPIVTQYLRVKVVGLEATVMNMRCTRSFKKEEAVMVDLFVTTVEPEKDSYILTGIIVDELGWEEVEVCRIELVALFKVGHTHAKVTQLVHGSRSFLESLSLIHISVLFFGLFTHISCL